MNRQERAYRLVYQDGSITAIPMTRNEAEAAFATHLGAAEIVKVVRRKSGAFREETKA